MKYSRKDGFKQYDSVSQATNKFLLYLKKINLGYEYAMRYDLDNYSRRLLNILEDYRK